MSKFRFYWRRCVFFLVAFLFTMTARSQTGLSSVARSHGPQIECEDPIILIENAVEPKVYGDYLLVKRRDGSPFRNHRHFVFNLQTLRFLPEVYTPLHYSVSIDNAEVFPFGFVARRNDPATSEILTYTIGSQGWEEHVIVADTTSSEYLIGPSVYVSDIPLDSPLGFIDPHYFRKSYVGAVKPIYQIPNNLNQFVSQYDFMYCLLDSTPFATEGCYYNQNLGRPSMTSFRITDPVAQIYRLFGTPKITVTDGGLIGFIWTGIQYGPYPVISNMAHFRTVLMPDGTQDTHPIYQWAQETGELLDHVHGFLSVRSQSQIQGPAFGYVDPSDALLPSLPMQMPPQGPRVTKIRLTRFFDSSPSSQLSDQFLASELTYGGTNGRWRRGIYISQAQDPRSNPNGWTFFEIQLPNTNVSQPYLVFENKRKRGGGKQRGVRVYFTAVDTQNQQENVMTTFCHEAE